MSKPNEPNAWERQPHESAKAYAAFCIYRDLGVKSRSLLLAYRLQPGFETAVTVPGFWCAWSTRYEWVRRVHDYDVRQEQIARKTKEAAHSQALEAFRKRQLDLSSAGARAAVQLLLKSATRLSTMEAAEITPRMLPAFFRAAAHVGAMSLEAEGAALGLDELTALLEDNDNVG